MKLKTVVVCALLACGLLSAKKDRDWKTGILTDSRTVDTGSVGVVRQPHVFVGPAPPLPTRTSARTLSTAELQITAGDYIYVVRDGGSNSFLLHDPCRYIVGDPIKYVQDKLIMYLIDADGTECRAQVMKQERVPPPAPPGTAPGGPLKEPAGK